MVTLVKMSKIKLIIKQIIWKKVYKIYYQVKLTTVFRLLNTAVILLRKVLLNLNY